MGVLLTRLMVSTCVTRIVAVYFVMTFRCAVYPCILNVFFLVLALCLRRYSPIRLVRLGVWVMVMGYDYGCVCGNGNR